MNEFIVNHSVFLISLGFAFLLSLFPFVLYRITNPKFTRDTHFEFSLIFTTPVVYLIMFFIGTNIALSIGLVGSLSVIRFRTAIKSPKDLIYLLFAICIGVGLGSQNLKITILATILLSLFILMIEKTLFKQADDSGSYVNFETSQDMVDQILSEYIESQKVEVISISHNENIAFVNLKSQNALLQNYDLYKKISKNPAIKNVQIFNQ